MLNTGKTDGDGQSRRHRISSENYEDMKVPSVDIEEGITQVRIMSMRKNNIRAKRFTDLNNSTTARSQKLKSNCSSFLSPNKKRSYRYKETLTTADAGDAQCMSKSDLDLDIIS